MMKIFAPKTIALAAVLTTLASGLAHAEMTQPSVAYAENAETHLNRASAMCDGCGPSLLHRFSSDESLFGGSNLDGVR